jgi:hypothetical protein
MGQKCESEQFALYLRFIPVGVIPPDPLASQFPSKRTHIESQIEKLLACHASQDLQLEIPRCF